MSGSSIPPMNMKSSALLLLTLTLAAAGGLNAQTIAFVGYNADGTDDLAFVALSEITAGTSVIFTDNEWNGTSFNTGESFTTWTATSAVAAGTVVVFNNFTAGNTASTGTLAPLAISGSTNRGFATGGDGVYAYVGSGSSPSSFLAFINAGDAGVSTGTGLSSGRVVLLSASSDGGAYIGSRAGLSSLSAYLLNIQNVASNWNDVANGDGTSLLPFNTTAFTAIPEPASAVALAGLGILGVAATRRRRA